MTAQPCDSCTLPNATPSPVVPSMCMRCWGKLPEVTRVLYKHGGLRIDRLVALSKERNVSVRTLRGGKR